VSKHRGQDYLKRVWQLLALGLLLFALLVSLIRGLLPQVPQIRQQLVEYLQKTYQLDVQISSLAAQWQAFGPELTINGLVIPPQDALPITLIIEKVHLKVDFWDSLASFSPQVESVTFDGVQVAVDLSHVAPKPVATDDIEEAASETHSNRLDWLYALALEQLSHFSITNASVQLLSDVKRFKPIYINNLVWLNTNGRHRGEGQLLMDPEGLDNESVALRVDLSGNGYYPDTVKGQAYLLASEVDLGQWLNRKKPLTEDSILQNLIAKNIIPKNLVPKKLAQVQAKALVLESKLNFEAWFSLGQGSLTSGVLIFKPSWLAWANDKHAQKFSLDSGAITFDSTTTGWQIKSHELSAFTNDTPWPELAMDLSYHQQGFSANFSPIDVTLMAPFLALVPSFDSEMVNKWQQLAPQGIIGPLNGHYSPQAGWSAKTSLNQMQWQASSGIPGINAIDGSIAYHKQKDASGSLDINLPAQAYQLDFSDKFEAPLAFDGKAIHGQFDFNDKTLILPALNISNQDIELALSLTLTLKQDAYLTLAANARINKAEHLGQYFPLAAMSPELVDYLNGAIIAGNIPDAEILWHGALSAYPYADDSGVFQAGFHLEKARYEFEPDWPAIDDLSLYALFENAAMDIWVDKGQLQQVAIDGAHVYIPELGGQSLLRVEADLATQASAATAVLQNSPLKHSVGKVLEAVQVKGNIRSQLDLSIPLFDGQDSRIAGGVSFINNSAVIATTGLMLTNISGDISFINNELLGKSLKAKVFEQPVTFSFATEERDNNLGLALDMQGQVILETLPAELQTPLEDYYQGQFNWDGAMTMVFEPQGHRLQLQLSSDLVGTALLLPPPFAKSADISAALEIELLGDDKVSTLSVKLGDNAEFLGGFDQQNGDKLAYYDVLLGRHFRPGDKLNKHQGNVQLAMAKMALSPWLPVLDILADMSAAKAESELFFPALESVYGRVQGVDLQGLKLNELNFTALPLKDRWRFVAESLEFDGRVDLFPLWQEQGLAIKAKRFYLSSKVFESPLTENVPVAAAVQVTAPISAPIEQEKASLLTKLPKLKLKVDDFQYDGLMLGQLILEGQAKEGDYHFDKLSLTKEGVSLVSDGTWSLVDGGDVSEFNLEIVADKFDLLSQALQIEPGVKDSPLKLKGHLAWQAPPHEFELAKLDGKLTFELGKGHLSQISDKGARIFSLFSLDSLLRKLSFDFSDVFGKGLYFDEFKGDLSIEKGVVKTKNTEMDAIAGNMKVRGYTDLSTQSLNYDIRFVPQLASSVPTVVLLSTSAWTLGVGAFALTKVLEPVIEIISEIRFRVTGTMNDPIIEELERKVKEIEIPESALPPKSEVPALDNQTLAEPLAPKLDAGDKNSGVSESKAKE
jgi:uncharacterized protein (TIGR02099 family)